MGFLDGFSRQLRLLYRSSLALSAPLPLSSNPPNRSQTMNDMQQRIASSFAAQGLMQTLGARLVLVEDGEVHIELAHSGHLSQQHGFVHAGAVTSIVDTACGYAALTRAPAGGEVVTAEFKINFLRPALGDRFLAVGKVQNAGKSLAVCTGEVRAFTGEASSCKVVALMQATIVNVAYSVKQPDQAGLPRS
jgi:uncharacterized protein (TIGR00369 family)